MAQITNTVSSFNLEKIREDISDLIENIAPSDTPFLSSIETAEPAGNTLFQWEEDTLAAPQTNEQLEGDDITAFSAATFPQNYTNQLQISRKTFLVAGTTEEVNKVGRKSEIARLLKNRGKELKLDVEAALIQNQVSVSRAAATPGRTRGLEGFLATNGSVGATGALPNPFTNTAPTIGTVRTLTEAIFRTAAQNCYTSGGSPTMVMMPPAIRNTWDSFTGNASRYIDSKDMKLWNTIKIYQGPFGNYQVVVNRQIAKFAGTATTYPHMFLLQSDMFAIKWLGDRKWKTIQLAQTGDAQKYMLLSEYGLVCRSEKSSAQIRDVQ